MIAEQILAPGTLYDKLKRLNEYYNNGEERKTTDLRMKALAKMMTCAKVMPEFDAQEPDAEEQKSVPRLKDSVIISNDRFYEGQTNKDGKPDGRGILIDLHYRACFEGWFKHDAEQPGRLRIINGDGWSELTDQVIDFDKRDFDFNKFKKPTRRYEPPTFSLKNCSNNDRGVVKEKAVESYKRTFALEVEHGKMTHERSEEMLAKIDKIANDDMEGHEGIDYNIKVSTHNNEIVVDLIVHLIAQHEEDPEAMNVSYATCKSVIRDASQEQLEKTCELMHKCIQNSTRAL